MAKCLVLGANGFIGSHLVDALSEKGHKVKAFGHFTEKVQFDADAQIVKGDFLNRGDLASAVKGVDYVFHFLSITTPATSEVDPIIDIETNIKMTVELLKLCSQEKVKRVIFASSGGAIYGSGGKQPHKETDLLEPISPYAIGKSTIEDYLRYFKVVHELDSMTFRISNPYGERQPFRRKQGVIPIFLERICRGEPLTVLGDGSMSRDYIYVRDLVSIIAEIFALPKRHMVYNLGSGTPTTINEIIALIELVVGFKPKVNHVEAPKSFVDNVSLNTEQLNLDFGIMPVTNMEDGIRATYEHIRREIYEETKQ